MFTTQPMTGTRAVILLFVIPELLFVAWLFVAAVYKSVALTLGA